MSMPGADMAQKCRRFFGEQEDQEEKTEEKTEEKPEETEEMEKTEMSGNETLFLSTGETNEEMGTGTTGETAETATVTVAAGNLLKPKLSASEKKEKMRVQNKLVPFILKDALNGLIAKYG
jgi:hypothetical protein